MGYCVMQKFDSTKISSGSTLEKTRDNVVRLASVCVAAEFLHVQKQDVFQQKIQFMLDGLSHRMDLDAQLYSALTELLHLFR